MTDFDILWLHDTLRLYLWWEHVHLESPLLLFKAPGFRKMKSVLAPWPECHGVAPNLWLAAMFPVPSGFLSVWACVFQKVTRLTIEILAIQTGWDECWMKQYFVQFSGTMWSENPALSNFIDKKVSFRSNKISIVMSCFLQSCATVIDEPRFSFVDCESGEYHFTGAGGYSLVYSCPALSQHLTAKQG